MKKILVIQHIAHEILGTLNPLLREAGFRIKYVNFARNPDLRVDLKNYEGLIILGGPMNVDQTNRYPHLDHEVELIQAAIRKDIPTLGICLGAQLVAKALGAEVSESPEAEVGWYDVTLTAKGKEDPLFKGFNKIEKLFQWHEDRFQTPEGAIRLAESSTCPHQAFRYRKNVYGFQFHLEVDLPMIERWLKVEANQKILEGLKDKTNPGRIRKESFQYLDRLQALSHETFGAFIQLFGTKEKYFYPASR